MKNFLYGLGTLFCILILIFLLIRTPDTKIAEMEEKYGLGSVQRLCYGVDGNCVRIREDGNPENPALVLIHGSSDSLLTWRQLVDRLDGKYRIITLDLPGHGLSGEQKSDDYSAAQMIEAVHALANHKELDKFVLGGNSMGGWVSWRYALAHPERLSGLILINASGAPLPEGSPQARVYLGATLMEIPLVRTAMQHLTPRSIIRQSLEDSVYNSDIITDDLVDQYWELLRYPGNRRATALRSITDREPAYADNLTDIKIPTLIIWGKDDLVIPVGAAQTFNERIANSILIIYENIGHLPQRETPDNLSSDIDEFMGSL